MKNTNTTLGRKAKSGAGKNEGLYKPKTAKNQMGDNASFAFNGQMGDGVNKSGDRWAGNHTGLKMKENYGLKESQRRGTASDSHADRMDSIGPSVTKDPERMTVATASQGGVTEEHGKVPHIANPDAIYISKASR
jgi:hypothetical protein